MTQEQLSENLKSEAIRNGLCQQWQQEWNGANKQTLITMYLSGIDFCIQNNYPPLSFIKENFEKDILHYNSIYVDEQITERNPTTPVVVNGECHGIMMFDGCHSATIYVRHSSTLHIEAKGLSKVWVHVYDGAKVNIEQKEGAAVYVYPYGENSIVNFVGDVKVRKRKNL